MNDTTQARRGPAAWLLVFGLLASWAQSAQAQWPPHPVAGSGPAAASTAAMAQHYPIVDAAAKGVAGKLREIYGGRGDVQISAGPAGHVVVHAVPQVQQEVANWLGREGLIASTVQGAQQNAAQTVAYREPERVQTQAWQLRNLTARDFESKLTKTWGTSLQSSQDPVGDVATFRFPPTTAGTTSIVVDRRTNTATVASPASSAASWQRLLTILDSRPKSTDERTSIIPLVKADPATIRRAVTLLSKLFSEAHSNRKQHIGQFVSMLFQEAGGAAQPAQPAQPPAPRPAVPAGDATAQAIPAGGAASAASMEAIARINNVQIEILDDVIVVRGRKEDV